MAERDFDKEYDAAVTAAALSDKTEPRAVAARYDRRSNRIIVELRNVASFLFPPELAQGLRENVLGLGLRLTVVAWARGDTITCGPDVYPSTAAPIRPASTIGLRESSVVKDPRPVPERSGLTCL